MVNRQELQDAIDKSLKKIKGSKENDICRYLPMETGGYMHHFTMRKMKTEDPVKLFAMIKKFILDGSPKRVAPKPRKPRGSRKRHDLISLSRRELERVLGHIRRAGDTELISKLSPRRSLTLLKRQLIASVRKNEIDQELWHAYVDTVMTQIGSPQDRPELVGAGTMIQATQN